MKKLDQGRATKLRKPILLSAFLGTELREEELSEANMDRKTLMRFINGKSPEDYDFKKLMGEYYLYYTYQIAGNTDDGFYEHVLPNELRQLTETEDSIERWYLYKTFEEQNKLNKTWFHCDSSNHTCDLTDAIYETLWYGETGFQLSKFDFGGDTMNSFAYTFGQFGANNLRPSAKKTYERQYEGSHDVKEIQNIFSEYACRVSCIGNFCLVPLGYNGYRGNAENPFKDYWDLSLNNLKYNKDHRDWLGRVGMSFQQYIHIFFLWDYVNKDFHVLPLCQSHTGMLGLCAPYPYQSPYPKGTEFREFTSNANIRILRRGIFMAAMLRIAVDPECGDDYKSRIVPFLSTEECPGTMEDVLDQLKADCKSAGFSRKTTDILQQIKLPELEKKI